MISRLTVNQRAVFAGLAKSPTKEPRGGDFSNRLEMSSSSIQRTNFASLTSAASCIIYLNYLLALVIAAEFRYANPSIVCLKRRCYFAILFDQHRS